MEIVSILMILLGIWIAVEMAYTIIHLIVSAFQGGPPPPNAKVRAAPRPGPAPYRPLAVALYQRIRAT